MATFQTYDYVGTDVEEPKGQMEQLPQEIEPLPTAVSVMIFIFIALWLISGVAAFIMSIMCFGYSGTTVQHIIGFLLALFFGPFYWIYYFYVKSYCGVVRIVNKKRRARG